MRAIEVNHHLNSLIPDLNLPNKTVDRVIYGDPEREVAGIAVAWMPYRVTIERAREVGANVLVVHEPTFFDHWDLDGKLADIPEAADKRDLIDSAGLTVIRCHDIWDALPDIGIPYAWGDFLELGKPSKTERYYNVYEVPEQAAAEFAAKVASKTAPLGQPGVGFYGDPEAQVTSVGLGTGCISDPFRIYAMGADLAISVDDVVRAWVAGEWCQDTGKPLLVVNHCVAEEPGMVTLAEHLRKTFPGLPVTHIPQQCTYRSITA
jgi:putative NIF3 family GTP cyclohydrolase 1 type 2